MRQGEVPAGMLLVARGSVEVSYLSEDGNQSIIFIAGEGDELGWVEAVAERPCAATCTAFPGSAVLFCPTEKLAEDFSNPTIVRNIARSVHSIMMRDNHSRTVDNFYTAEQRICAYLHQLSERSPELHQSQSYLADVVNCSRQSVNRELGTLRDMGILALGKGVIDVKDRAALKMRITRLGEDSTRRIR